ncbi:MAG: molybdopterin-dependent oxidoreductase [Burkholderiaceae bacterium]|nr:molybdopterin-dependent oxidoreductase [Burkholderiaceae bacterium]
MTELVSRRRFLQISSAAFGAGAVATQLPPFAADSAAAAAGNVKQVPTFCEMCFWRCGGIAYVRDGKLWKFEGNPLDPQSRGRLCPRGTGAIGAHYDPDRLQKPLLRKGERGKEQWAAVTWDEAFSFIADKMKKIKVEHGAESIAMFNHGVGVRFIQHVLKSYGAVNFAGPSFAQCRGPRDVGFMLTMGFDLGSPEPTDIENTDCLVLIGSHLGENMHNTQVQEFANAVARKATIIVVDPRYSVAASKARHWLPIRPGTDLALILAWMNVLVNEGLYDREFVGTWGHGFDKFVAEIKSATPEWAAQETGIEADADPRHRARAGQSPAGEPRAPGTARELERRRYATQPCDCAAQCAARQLGPQGRLLHPRPTLKLPRILCPSTRCRTSRMVDNPNQERYPFAHEAVTTGIRDATLSGKPYPIKAWWVYSTDLIHALPNEAETLKAIDQLDLMVVVDTMPAEIAGYADVVLPEVTFLERYDEILNGWGRQGWLSLRQPVVAAPHDQKPGWWMAKQLAEKLGIPECMPFKDIEEYLAFRIEKTGLDWAKFKAQGVFMGPKKPITVEDGVRTRVRHALGQDRVLLRPARAEAASTRCPSTRRRRRHPRDTSR